MEDLKNNIYENNVDDFKSLRAIIEKSLNTNTLIPYYPLPCSEGYEKFLKTQKKDVCKFFKLDQRTQYSIQFLLSMKEKYKDKPEGMKEIKLPIKSEIRSRAKILTDEAFRETRNYIKTTNKNNNFDAYLDLAKKKSDKYDKNLGEYNANCSEIKELLNKITNENYSSILKELLKINYSNDLLEALKDMIHSKAVTERKYRDLYIDLCIAFFNKFNNEVNFKSIFIKKCEEELYSPFLTIKCDLDDEEKIEFLQEVKLGNIKILAELYNKGVIDLISIESYINFGFENVCDLNIRIICELIKKICLRFHLQNSTKLNTIVEKLEKL